jgi:transcription antitermination factor NusG
MPAALPDKEIAALRTSLMCGVRAEPHRFLTVGRLVRVKRGPLAGMRGILVQRKGKYRVVISIDLIQRSIQVDIETDALELAG